MEASVLSLELGAQSTPIDPERPTQEVEKSFLLCGASHAVERPDTFPP